MSIQDTFHFDKGGEVVRHGLIKRFFLVLVIVLVAILAFGRLSGHGASGVSVSYDPSFLNDASSTGSTAATTASRAASGAGEIFASSLGTQILLSGLQKHRQREE